MKIRPYKKFNPEDFDEEQKDLVIKIGEYLNIFNHDLYNAFNKRISISDNLNQELKDITVNTDVSSLITPINIKTEIDAKGLIPVKVFKIRGQDILSQVYVDWDLLEDKVRIKQVFGLAPNSEYKITVLIISN